MLNTLLVIKIIAVLSIFLLKYVYSKNNDYAWACLKICHIIPLLTTIAVSLVSASNLLNLDIGILSMGDSFSSRELLVFLFLSPIVATKFGGIVTFVMSLYFATRLLFSGLDGIHNLPPIIFVLCSLLILNSIVIDKILGRKDKWLKTGYKRLKTAMVFVLFITVSYSSLYAFKYSNEYFMWLQNALGFDINIYQSYFLSILNIFCWVLFLNNNRLSFLLFITIIPSTTALIFALEMPIILAILPISFIAGIALSYEKFRKTIALRPRLSY